MLRNGGYTVLQYWYFYPMNDWRSTFAGVNDHEADWETISVYLVPTRTATWRRPGSGRPSHESPAPICAAAGTTPSCAARATTR